MHVIWCISELFLDNINSSIIKHFHVLNRANLHFSDHNSEQARLTRLPYHLGEDQKLPVYRVAKVALLFCLLVSCKAFLKLPGGGVGCLKFVI